MEGQTEREREREREGERGVYLTTLSFSETTQVVSEMDLIWGERKQSDYGSIRSKICLTATLSVTNLKWDERRASAVTAPSLISRVFRGKENTQELWESRKNNYVMKWIHLAQDTAHQEPVLKTVYDNRSFFLLLNYSFSY